MHTSRDVRQGVVVVAITVMRWDVRWCVCPALQQDLQVLPRGSAFANFCTSRDPEDWSTREKRYQGAPLPNNNAAKHTLKTPGVIHGSVLLGRRLPCHLPHSTTPLFRAASTIFATAPSSRHLAPWSFCTDPYPDDTEQARRNNSGTGIHRAPFGA